MRTEPAVAVVEIDRIDVGDRSRKDYGDIDSLVASIKEHGIIQPLAVRESGERFLLVAGGRRFKAIELAGLTTVPVRVYGEDMDELDFRTIELIENVERKDLTMEEELESKLELHTLQTKKFGEKKSTSPDAPGWSMRDTAKMLNSSVGALSEDLKLARAMKDVPELKQAKNKNEASKLMRRLEEQMILEEIAKRAKNKETTTGVSVLKRSAMDSFQVGDCISGCMQLSDGSIELAEIDPPYGVGLDAITKEGSYKEVSKKDFATLLSTLMPVIYNKMKGDAWALVWYPTEKGEVVREILTSAGFRGNWVPIIWTKPGSRERVQRPEVSLANGYESCYYVMKGNPRLIKMGESNVFPYKTVDEKNRRHPAERPITLMESILSIFATPGTRTIVPFAGSGSTLLACANLGMPVIGWDTVKTYKDSYDVFVDQNQMPFRNSKEG